MFFKNTAIRTTAVGEKKKKKMAKMVRQLATVQDPAHTELRIQEVLMLPAMKEF